MRKIFFIAVCILIIFQLSIINAKIDGEIIKMDKERSIQIPLSNGEVIYSFSDGQSIKMNTDLEGKYALNLGEIYCWRGCNIYPSIYAKTIEVVEGSQVVSYLSDYISNELRDSQLDYKTTNVIFDNFKTESPTISPTDNINNEIVSEYVINALDSYTFVNWTGLIYSQSDNLYKFKLDIYGAGQVLMNDKKILNFTDNKEFSINLKEGFSNISILYYYTEGNPNLVYWDDSSQRWKNFNKSQLLFLSGGSKKISKQTTMTKSAATIGPFYPDTFDYSYTLKEDNSLIANKNPLILIHGVSGGDPYWETIPDNFITNGHQVWEFYYTPNDLKVERGGVLLDDALSRILLNYPGKKADLVAHSMGGLLSRTYINDLSKDSSGNIIFYKNNVRSLIMIGTPNYGSYLANRCLNYFGEFLCGIFKGPAIHDLVVGSQIVLDNYNKGLRDGINYLAIAGTDDDLIWSGIPFITFESDDSDSVVSASSVSLLNFGVPLVLIKANHNNEHGNCATAFGDRCRAGWSGFYYDDTMSNLITDFINGATTNTLKSNLYSNEYYINPNDPNADTSYPYSEGAILIKFTNQNPSTVKIRSKFLINGAIRDFNLEKNQETGIWFYFGGSATIEPGLTLPSGNYDIYADNKDTNQDIEVKTLQTNIREISNQPSCNPVNSCCDGSGNLIPAGGQPDPPLYDGVYCVNNQRTQIDYDCTGNNDWAVNRMDTTLENCSPNKICNQTSSNGVITSVCLNPQIVKNSTFTSSLVISSCGGMCLKYNYSINVPTLLPDGIKMDPNFIQTPQRIKILDIDNKPIEMSVPDLCLDPGNMLPSCQTTNSFKEVLYDGIAISQNHCTISSGSTTLCWQNASTFTLNIDNTCTPNILNFTQISWQNISCLKNDKMNQSQTTLQYDINHCGTFENQTIIIYNQNQTCDYCKPNPINTTFTDWQNQTLCSLGDYYIQNRSKIEYDANYSFCYAVTGIQTDLWNSGQNKTYLEARSQVCDFCTPNITNTTWSNWQNISLCNTNDKINQSRFRVQYDNNSCPDHNVQNQNLYEYNKTNCDFCTPNWTCSEWEYRTDDKAYCKKVSDTKRCYEQTKLDNDAYKGDYSEFTHYHDYCQSNIQGPFYASWSACSESFIKTRTGYYTDNNYYTCCLITNITSDCGIRNSTYQNYTETAPCSFTIDSSLSGIYNTCNPRFVVSTKEKSSKIEFQDYHANKLSRWSTLCTNCNLFNKTKSQSNGQHNIILRATINNSLFLLNTSLIIDCKDPQISKTMPSSGKYTNGFDFYIKYTEDNCQSLKIYANGQEALSSPCESDNNVEKNASLNISHFNGQEINYQFIITDIAGNSRASRLTKVKVDTTPPEIKDFQHPVYGRYVYFNMTILNEDKNTFNKVEYNDSFDGTKAKWKSLCTSLNKANNCYKKLSLKSGTHTITIKATDKAGNSDSESISIVI